MIIHKYYKFSDIISCQLGVLRVTGLTTPDGRFTIIMPHPERIFLSHQYSWLLDDWDRVEGPWMQMFVLECSPLGGLKSIFISKCQNSLVHCQAGFVWLLESKDEVRHVGN